MLAASPRSLRRVLLALAPRLNEFPRHEHQQDHREGHGMRHQHRGRAIGIGLPDKVLKEGRLEALDLSVKGTVLVESGVAQQAPCR